jgi:predicted nucleotidyltransferase
MPRKRPQASAARQPLAFALGTPAKVATLRALAGAGEPITQRDAARRAGVQHRSVQLALDDLVQLAIVTRQAGGRDYLVRLNDAHRLVPVLRALFRAEADHFLELRRCLAQVASDVARRTGLVSVALFGSVARARDLPSSDCDVLIVARDDGGLTRAMEAFEVCAVVLRESHGCRLAPIGYVRTDAARRWRARAAPFNEISRDALIVFGPPLAEALRDKA